MRDSPALKPAKPIKNKFHLGGALKRLMSPRDIPSSSMWTERSTGRDHKMRDIANRIGIPVGPRALQGNFVVSNGEDIRRSLQPTP